MSEVDKLLSTARAAQEERKRVEKTLEVSRARELAALTALEKAVNELRAGLSQPAQTIENVVLSDDPMDIPGWGAPPV